MEGVGPGTTLGGRFTLTTRTGQVEGTERWDATEPELARTVSVLCLPADDPRVPAVLDAARVAAGLEIPTTVRVLDIGTEGPVAYVVEESLAQAESVSDLVRSGGLPGEEIRRIAGEVATALAAAGGRGVHHLRLTPDDVFRTSEGAVKVRGLATAAAVGGLELAGEQAARTDATGVVALTYAGLTGRWPLPDVPASLDAAPRSFGGVAAPSEIAAGVPRDLDGLCRMTLSGRGGPTSPGDFARQVAPWSSRPVVGRPTGSPAPADAPRTAPAESGAAGVSPPAGLPAASRAGESSNPLVSKAAPGPGQPTVEPGGGADSAKSGSREGNTTTTRGRGLSGAAAAVGGAVAAVSAARATAATRAGAALKALPAASSTARSADGDRLEPPAPLVPAEPLTKEQSTVALALVAAFVVLALLVGINGVRKIGSQTDVELGSLPARSASASPPPATAEAGPQPKAILSADGFDPNGDNSENGDLAPKVFDGNPDTEWVSEGYRTANLGGLKPGVGVVVDLGPNVEPKIIRLNLRTPADVTVLASADRSLDNAATIGQLSAANGQVDLPVPEDIGARQYVIVWFTSVSQDGDGFFRAHLGEVTVLG